MTLVPATTAAASGQAAVAGNITTAAGGPGGPARATTVALPGACGVSFAAGAIDVADGAAVRQVSQAGWLTTPAGTGTAGPRGDGGPAVKASFDGACGAVSDHSRNLVIADTRHSRIRVAAAATGTFYGRAMTAGDVYTVAGNGTDGYSGDGGPATRAELDYPGWVAVDAAGNLVIADSMNNRIRVVAGSAGTFYGQAMTAGNVYTIAGTGRYGYSGDGGPATSAKIRQPDGVAVDGAGNVLISDTFNSRIRVVAESAGTFYGQAMKAGDIYTVAGDGQEGFSGDGGPATAASLTQPSVAAVDSSGNLVFADRLNSRIRVVADRTGRFYGQAMKAGDIYTVAGDGQQRFSGDGGPATAASFWLPGGVAIDAQGNLVIADVLDNRVRVVAATSGTFYGQAMTGGDIYTVAGNGTRGFSGDGGPATRAELYQPMATAVDAAGNTVIADTFNSRIRVVAAATGTFYGQAMTGGDIYTVAGDGTDGYSGNGGPATAAELYRPSGLGIDRDGNLLISDTYNNRVRVVAAVTGTFYGQPMTAGDIYTVAGDGQQGYAGDGGPATGAELYAPYGVAEDGKGNLVFSDTGNGRVRVVAGSTGRFYGRQMTARHIYTVAGGGSGVGDGGPATQGALQPGGIAVNAAGNLLVADSLNERIRVVAASTGRFYGLAMTVGDIYTVAGNGTGGFSGDGGPATGAALNFPQDVSLDGARNLLIADTDNQRIRVVAEHTGRFYGQAMTAGDIYTVAGNGTSGFSGDGGPAITAGFTMPWVVTADHAGDLLIADGFDNRIRVVAG